METTYQDFECGQDIDEDSFLGQLGKAVQTRSNTYDKERRRLLYKRRRSNSRHHKSPKGKARIVKYRGTLGYKLSQFRANWKYRGKPLTDEGHPYCEWPQKEK